MKKLFKNLYDFLQRDVGDESQSNNLSVLIRILSLVGIINYILDLFLIMTSHMIVLCFILLFGAGLLIGALICSYENHTSLSCVLYSTVVNILSILLTLTMGLSKSFLPMIMITALLAFYSLKLSNAFKRNYMIICGILYFATSLFYDQMPHLHEPTKYISIALLFLNLVHFCLTLAIIGFSFCQKFFQSEEKILQYNKKLQQMVSTDALTSLWNRRAMNEHLVKLQSDYTRHQKEFSVAIMDIDFFKSVNDTYGHGMGDVVLVRLSEILREHMKGHGHVARWGGEEFLISFEDMTFEKAITMMEKLREKVSKETFSQDDVSLNITITAGIEEYGFRSTLDTLLTKADEKLYKGKTNGRNQTVSSLF